MQIFISVIINIIILAVVLPLFYIYIVSRARERLEKETMSKAREEIEALVKEFNNIALSRISILEDAIIRASRLVKELNNIQNKKANTKPSETKQKNTEIENKKIQQEKNNNEEKSQSKKLDIRIEDNNNIENKDNNINNNAQLKESEKKENKIEHKENKTENKENNNIKKNNIDTAAKAIDDDARKEVIERLRSKLDKTIKSNIAIYDKPIEDKTIAVANEPLKESVQGSLRNDNIIRLYKEGLSKKEICEKLNCSMTEVDIVIDLEID